MNIESTSMAPPNLTKTSEMTSASPAANDTPEGISYAVCRSEVRLHELNRYLQIRELRETGRWFDDLATEFFTDDACLIITILGSNPVSQFTVKRNYIPRYFYSLMQGDVMDVLFLPGPAARENITPNSIVLECEHAMMIAQHGKPFHGNVITQGKLVLELTPNYHRFKTWHFSIQASKEYISCEEGAPLYQALNMRRASSVAEVDPVAVKKLESGLTQRGVTAHTLQFLRVQSVMEPAVQMVISQHKKTHQPPRECLRQVLVSSGQWPPRSSTAPPTTTRPPAASTPVDPATTTATQRRSQKRRKQSKSSAAQKKSSPDPAAAAQSSNMMPPAPPAPPSDAPSPFTHSLPGGGFPVPGELMTVGEPIMMGGDTYTKEDERLIARVENPQYEQHFEPSPASAAMSSMAMASPATPKLGGISQAASSVGLASNQPLDVCNGMAFSTQY